VSVICAQLLAQQLKVALADGRAKAEQLLLKDRHGRRCAEQLCRMEDEDHPHPV
jgi:[protein-PII] uridylyltransferase